MSPEAPTPGGIPDPNKIEKKLFKAAVINTDELVKAQARDIGDAKMTESKEDREANWFTRIGKRIWKHNLAQEWYRQREISRAKKNILESHDLYKGEKEFDPDKNTPDGKASEEAMQAIVERFISEHEEDMLKKKELESKKSLEDEAINSNIKDLIKQYAGSAMSPESFAEEKKRILSKYDKNIASEKSMYADNLLSIANEVRDAVTHGTKLAELDFDIDVTLGTARESLSTEAHLNSFDSTIEKLQNTKIGKYIANEPAVLGILAGAYELGRNSVGKLVRSKGAQWATFGGAAILAGGISAAKERARFTRERAQHARETAKGMEFKEKDMKRRQEMEGFSYETKKATMIIENLNADLAKIQEGAATPDEVNEIMGRLADLESRIKLNDQQKIDLITYDKFNTVEKDRTAMDLKRAELKVALRRGGFPTENEGTPNEVDFDTRLAQLTETQKGQLLGGDRGITQKDEAFVEKRNSRAWKAFATTTLTSITIGAVFAEGKALLDGSQDGIIEGAFKDKQNLIKHATGLEAIRRWWTGDHAMMPGHDSSDLHAESFGDTKVQLPNGVTFVENADNTYNLVRNGDVLVDHVPVTLDESGDLSDATKHILNEHGIETGAMVPIGETETQIIQESPDEYIAKHPELTHKIHRDLWYDNDTPHPFDQNELRTDWGGENNTGIDAQGNYVFNVSRMTADGSFHGANSVDAKQLIEDGKLKMLFSLSKGTQHQVFEVNIGPDGNAIIDPKSELGKLMFEQQGGHAVFTGKFAEVAQSTGMADDGGENVRILGTHVGLDKDTVDDIIDKEKGIPNVILGIPDETTYDTWVIPAGARRPLERGEYTKNATVEANRPRERRAPAPEEVPPAGPAPTYAPVDNAHTAENVYYSRDRGFSGRGEYAISGETSRVYGFMGLNRKDIDARLKDVAKDPHPEVFIFEEDAARRTVALKQIEDMKKWYPNKVKFTYVALPSDMSKLDSKEKEKYTSERFNHIVESSSLDKKVNQEIYVEQSVEKALLGEIPQEEWDAYVLSGNKASKDRLYSIAMKQRAGETLSQKERIVYEDNRKKVDTIIKDAGRLIKKLK